MENSSDGYNTNFFLLLDFQIIPYSLVLICRKNRDLELIYNNNTLYNNSVKNVEIILFEITYESRIITTLFSLLIFLEKKVFVRYSRID